MPGGREDWWRMAVCRQATVVEGVTEMQRVRCGGIQMKMGKVGGGPAEGS